VFTNYEELEKQRKRKNAALERERKMQQAVLSIKKKFGKIPS
jgi:DNA polymerase V